MKFSKDYQPSPERRKGGRPKKGGLIGAALKEILESQKVEYAFSYHDTKGKLKKIQGHIDHIEGGNIAQLLALVLVSKGLEGDVKALKEIQDRTEGRPQQKVEVDAPLLAGNIRVNFTSTGVLPVTSENDIKDHLDESM